MKVVALISGGKDSCYNMMQCVAAGHQIVALANLRPANTDELDSYMYQTVGHQAIDLYAEAMDLPLYRRTIQGSSLDTGRDYSQTEGDEVEDLYHLLKMVQVYLNMEERSCCPGLTFTCPPVLYINTVHAAEGGWLGHAAVIKISSVSHPWLKRLLHSHPLPACLGKEGGGRETTKMSEAQNEKGGRNPAQNSLVVSAVIVLRLIGVTHRGDSDETMDIEKEDVEAVSVGAILSDYQRVRVENVCVRLGLQPLAYLWRRDQATLLSEMISCDLHALLIKVAAFGQR
ncbi:unnamed protein product, partial [Coregonus sp. 'balchen']